MCEYTNCKQYILNLANNFNDIDNKYIIEVIQNNKEIYNINYLIKKYSLKKIDIYYINKYNLKIFFLYNINEILSNK